LILADAKPHRGVEDFQNDKRDDGGQDPGHDRDDLPGELRLPSTRPAATR
jgi:hypothetical protein